MSQTMAVSRSLRRDIAQGLLNLLTGLPDPETGQPLFAAVHLGAIFAPEVYPSWCEIAFTQGRSSPAGVGGPQIGWRIEDAITFTLTSGWDYEADSATAMLAMLHAQDVLLPLLHSHVNIPAPANPAQPIASVWGVLAHDPDRSLPVRLPVGRVYLLWTVSLLVQQQYNVLLTTP